MLHIRETIVVEGKYDRERLRKITDAPIIVTGGFTLYKDKKIINAIAHAAKETGIIILTDSDSAGFRIRNYIKQNLRNDGKILHAYIPSVKGKEKRKDAPGKEGILGVEGMTDEVLAEILKNTATALPPAPENEIKITKAMLYADGLSGKENSDEKRRRLAKELSLPPRLSPNAMIEILNRVYGYERYKKAVDKINCKFRKGVSP